ncbi:hypothetical protein KEM55_005116 [Ascosphaera atra]|nr:hypothetical protein KEM55_005116 [Ascosphaera atra]
MVNCTTPVHFLDIASGLESPLKSWSPNTNRTRMVLNYKNIDYTESYIPMREVVPMGERLHFKAQNNQGTTGPLHTFPAIIHKESIVDGCGAMNETMEIALHLERVFQGQTDAAKKPHPTLFPSAASYPLSVAVNHIIITEVAPKFMHVGMPKVPEILREDDVEYFRTSRTERIGMPLSNLVPKTEEEEEQALKAITDAFEPIVELLDAESYPGTVGSFKGPWLEGAQMGYADIIIVAYLAFMKRVYPKAWERVYKMGKRGEIARLWDASETYLEGQGKQRDIEEVLKENQIP